MAAKILLDRTDQNRTKKINKQNILNWFDLVTSKTETPSFDSGL